MRSYSDLSLIGDNPQGCLEESTNGPSWTGARRAGTLLGPRAGSLPESHAACPLTGALDVALEYPIKIGGKGCRAVYRLDMNCDVGESFGIYTIGNDEELLEVVSSANIACGFHAGDPTTMRKTVMSALKKGVAIGAHPGLPDRLGFGRRNMDITPQEAFDIVVYQVGALYGFVRAAGARLQHVKPHGALYNMAAKDSGLAEAVAEAVYKVDPELILFGLSGSELVKAGQKAGLRTAGEVFADRTYQEDGTLTPRRQPDALIRETDKAVAQVIRMVREGKVRSQQGKDVEIQADTVCIHGDGPHALEFARHIRKALTAAGISVEPVGKR